jgi:cysteinyl-tRNA synthetase
VVLELAGARHAARTARDFALADELRATIQDLGWSVRDEGDGFALVPDPARVPS